MTPREQGFLLLTSHLGNPERKPMTIAQFRSLIARVRSMEKPQTQRQIVDRDLIAIGYDPAGARRIIALLSDTQQLDWYVGRGARMDCYPITRVSESYPAILHRRLGTDCPGCLWAKGDVSLLAKPAVALVGCRDLEQENLAFAKEAGRQAALQGCVLVSGNARGADAAAQDACLSHGGQVISVVADSLEKQPLSRNILYLSEDGYDLAFNTARALSRNRIIHALGYITLVAQCGLRKGGTWDGTQHNLRNRLSPVFCFDDGSLAVTELSLMGAEPIDISRISDFSALQKNYLNFIDQ